MTQRRKICAATAIVCVLAIAVPVIHHFQLRFALEKYIAELKVKGEPMTLAQVIPPPVPPDQNAVPFIARSLTNLSYRSLVTTNPPLAMHIIAPGRALVGWQQSDISCSHQSNSWEDLAHELATAKYQLNDFHSLLTHPQLGFQYDYEKGFSIPLAHLDSLRRVSGWLNASALYELHENTLSNACANLRIMLALVQGLTEDRFAVSQVYRMGIAKNANGLTWEILQHPEVSENDLALLQQDWQALEFVKPYERAQLVDRVLFISGLDSLRKNPHGLWDQVMAHDEIKKAWSMQQWRWFWSYADEKLALQIRQVLIDASRMVAINRSFQEALSYTSANLMKIGIPPPDLEFRGTRIDYEASEIRRLFSDNARDKLLDLKVTLNSETARSMAITAIALKRFELLHHHSPGKLEELIPDFITTVRIDWMDGQPLRYHLNADGIWLLYSVGENGKDDGGSVSPDKDHPDAGFDWQNPHRLDHVWPQPATPELIQKYYASYDKTPLPKSKHRRGMQ